MELIVLLLVLLVATRIGGEAALHLRQPAVLGEIGAGVALGAGLAGLAALGAPLPAAAAITDQPGIAAVAELGLIFVMLNAGIEMQPRQLAARAGPGLRVAFGGMALPLLAGLAFGWLVLPEGPAKPAQALFLGVAMSVTDVPVTVTLLMDLRLLQSRIGQTVVSAAVFDDLLSLVLLAALTGLIGVGAAPGAAGLAWLALKVAAFSAIAVLSGRYLFPRFRALAQRLHGEAFGLSLIIAVALALAALAELLGLHYVLGPFVAGLFFDHHTLGRRSYTRVKSAVRAATTGLLAPIFFATVGLRLDFGAIGEAPLLALGLLLLAVAGKLLGAGLPARLTGMTRRQSLAVGAAMSTRGVVMLVIAEIALRAGLFEQGAPPDPVIAGLYPAVVLTAVATTLLAPPMLTAIVGGRGNRAERAKRKAPGGGPPGA